MLRRRALHCPLRAASAAAASTQLLLPSELLTSLLLLATPAAPLLRPLPLPQVLWIAKEPSTPRNLEDEPCGSAHTAAARLLRYHTRPT